MSPKGRSNVRLIYLLSAVLMRLSVFCPVEKLQLKNLAAIAAWFIDIYSKCIPWKEKCQVLCKNRKCLHFSVQVYNVIVLSLLFIVVIFLGARYPRISYLNKVQTSVHEVLRTSLTAGTTLVTCLKSGGKALHLDSPHRSVLLRIASSFLTIFHTDLFGKFQLIFC